MRSDPHAPTFVSYHVVDAFTARMARAFHCVASIGAARRCAIASPDIDRIRRMTKVISACELARLRIVGIRSGWHGEPESADRKSLRDGFIGHHRDAVGESKHAAHRPTEGVACNPDVGIGIHLGHVGEELAPGLIVAILLAESLDDASIVAAVGARCTVAYLVPKPGALLRTTA